MKKTFFCALACLSTIVWTGQAMAWSRGNMGGGSTTHTEGDTSHDNRWGGSSSHEAGEGTEHTNTYGGSSAHAYGGGTEHTNMYGGATAGRYGEGAYHTYPSGATAYHPAGYPAYPTYPAYHPPVAVASYSTGCYGCAAAAGAVVGVAAGVAVASASTAASSSAAYNAGVVAGAERASVPASGSWVMGMNYATLPAGSKVITTNGATYYVNGSVWFQPAYGANGVYYTVVPTP